MFDKPVYSVRVDTRNHHDPMKRVRFTARPHINLLEAAQDLLYACADTYPGYPCVLLSTTPGMRPWIIDVCE